MELNGLEQGIAQGLQMATQGMLQAEEITNKRQQVQQEAQKTAAYLKTAGLQQQNYEQEIEQNKIKISELNRDIARRDTWDVLGSFEATKDASVLNTIKSNPQMAQLLSNQGITGFSNVKDLSEEKLKQLGITPELLDDPTKRIVIANTSDGRQVPWNMMGIYATTGYLPKLGENKLQEIKLKSEEAKAKLEGIKADDALGWLKNNPGKTYSDYENQSDMSKLEFQRNTSLMVENLKYSHDLSVEKAKAPDAKKQGEADTYVISKAINSDIDKFTSFLKDSNKNDTVTIGDKKVSLYEAAKTYEDAQPQQLDTNYKNELRGKKNVVEGSNRILTKLDFMPEWNIGTKGISEVEKVVGDFTKSLTNNTNENTKAGTDTTAKLKEIAKGLPGQDRVYLESYVFPVVADYIKAMSGAAVSENERTAYISNMTAGWMADKSSFKAAITGFRDGVNDSFSSMLDGISSSYPKTYLDLKVSNKDTGSKATSSTQTTSVKEGDTKEYNGVIYKVVGNKWVPQGASK